MGRLNPQELKDLLREAKLREDSRGVSLLERARQSLQDGSYLNYYAKVLIEEDTIGAKHVEWNCPCPHSKHTGEMCKHVLARILLMHEYILREHSEEWDRWFKEYNEPRIKEALEAFAQF